MTRMPEPVTLSEVVHRAVKVCDPDRTEGLDDLLARFEDADAPLSSVEAGYAAEAIAESVGALDPQQEDAAMTMAAALATYLAYRRDEVDDRDEAALLARAARAEFDGHPPANVSEWLAARGVSV